MYCVAVVVVDMCLERELFRGHSSEAFIKGRSCDRCEPRRRWESLGSLQLSLVYLLQLERRRSSSR